MKLGAQIFAVQVVSIALLLAFQAIATLHCSTLLTVFRRMSKSCLSSKSPRPEIL